MQRWLILALLLVVGWLLPGRAIADKSFALDRLVTHAVVATDGSMNVTEQVTYRYSGGPFNFGIRSFETRLSSVVDFSAADDGGPLQVITPSTSQSGQWEWHLRQPTSDQTVTYTLTYRVNEAMRLGSDVADLNWKFLGSDHPGVGAVDITVTTPGSVPAATPTVAKDDTTVLRGFAHGPSNGNIDVRPSTVEATVTDVPARQFVELRVIAPITVFDRPGAAPNLAAILAQEEKLANPAKPVDRKPLGWVITPMLTALGVAGTGALWFVGGRERKSTEVLGEYWREPIDEPPAVAAANLARGSIQRGPMMAGTIVDMAQRGYLRIIGERHEQFGPDKVVHRYQWLGKPFADDVSDYERQMMEFVFAGADETTSDAITARAKDDPVSAKAKLDSISAGVQAAYNERGYEDSMNGKLMGVLLALVAVVGIGGYVVTRVTKNGVGWVGVAAAVAMLVVGGGALRNRTQVGVEAAAKAQGLKNYIKDFSQLADAPVGHLILWERYLVYAVAFGVSADLMKGLTTRVPEVVNNPGFAVWYVGGYGRFDGYDQIDVNTSQAVSASQPNTSGSGGGFSGGSSGGGGGGGFGAR